MSNPVGDPHKREIFATNCYGKEFVEKDFQFVVGVILEYGKITVDCFLAEIFEIQNVNQTYTGSDDAKGSDKRTVAVGEVEVGGGAAVEVASSPCRGRTCCRGGSPC